MRADLAEIFQSGAHARHLILTPNRALQRTLLQTFDAHAAQTMSSWRTPNIVAIEDYMSQFWSAALARGEAVCGNRYLLNADEERELWRQAAQTATNTVLLAPGSAADELQKAWYTLWRWDIDPLGDSLVEAARYHLDCEYFLRAAQEFSAVCERLGACSRALTPALSKLCTPPEFERVSLYEFDELPPAFKTLFEAWNISPDWLIAPPGSPDEIAIATVADTREEFRQAALWAKALSTENEWAKIAIVVPELSSQRQAVETAFLEVFEPNYFLPQTSPQTSVFNILAGTPLSKAPVLAAAMQLWELNTGTIAVDRLAELLYSPYFREINSGSSTDAEALAELERRCRDYEKQVLSLNTLVREAKQTNDKLAEKLQGILDTNSERRTRTAASWLHCLNAQLLEWGWPGQRALDSLETQHLESFKNFWQALPRVLELRFQADELLPVHAVIGFLQEQLLQQSFQAETVDARINVIAAFEASGQDYDAIWVCAVHDQAWPVPARPSPFIPIALQKQLRMPNCSAERELEVAEKLLARYATHCQTLVCSFSQFGEHSEQLPSPLLNTLFPHAQEFQLAPLKSEQQAPALALQSVDDVSGTPLSADERVATAVDILKRQAQCPFQAFVRHRLASPAWPAATAGWSARLRGTILHDTMEAVWAKLQSSRMLKQQTEAQLEKITADAVQAAFKQHRYDLQRYPTRLSEMEGQQMQQLVSSWLTHEKDRDDFTVFGHELELELEIFQREVRLRIDRVDQLEDSTVLLIDYKSGKLKSKALIDDTLIEPQLPLYTLAWQKKFPQQAISGVALASVRQNESEWRGVGSAEKPGMAIAKGMRQREGMDWPTRLDSWHAELHRLEQDFLAGHAEPAPLDPATCRNCDYRAVCRFQKQSAEIETQ